MSYEKTTWQSGDVVTSAKLNKIEDGIASASAGGVLIVNMSSTTGEHSETIYTLNKTWKEIHDAFIVGTTVLVEDGGIIGSISYTLVAVVYFDGTVYGVDLNQKYGVSMLSCDSENGYPTYLSI